MSNSKKIRIAAMGDLHVKTSQEGIYREVFSEISQKADILLLCGDLTDHGLIEEAEILVKDLSMCTIPVVGVLGNHDYAQDQQIEIKEVLSKKGNFHSLGDEPFVFENIGFAGVKGFCGGFDKYMLSGFGEDRIRNFVYEAVNEALRLESLLTQLETEKKVVALHYAPIRETIAGEPLEIHPFLGSSRLLDPLERFEVSVAFHGHSHHGIHHAKSPRGVEIYNVSMHVLQNLAPKQMYTLVEV